MQRCIKCELTLMINKNARKSKKVIKFLIVTSAEFWFEGLVLKILVEFSQEQKEESYKINFLKFLRAILFLNLRQVIDCGHNSGNLSYFSHNYRG